MHTDGQLASQPLTLSSPPADQGKPARPVDRSRGNALGLVSTESFPAVVGTADAMVKAADVFLVGYEKTGSGHCTAIVRGGVADIRMAVAAGVETAQQFGQYLSSSVIPRPLPNLEAVLPICARWDQLRRAGHNNLGNHAIGLLETRGFPAMVGAADAMTKAADVQLMAHEAIGDGLCTILVRGSLPNVAIAIDAGIHEAERIGELHAVMVIPRPLGDLEDSLPQISLEEEQPLHLPLVLATKTMDKELEPLPVDISTREPLTLELEQPSVPPNPQ